MQLIKKHTKHLFYYSCFLAASLAILLSIINYGQVTIPGQEIAQMAIPTGIFEDFILNFKLPLVILLLQVVVILLTARYFGYVANKLSSPQVIGHMIAGIVLGKSVLGYLWPMGYASLFPDSSISRLFALGQFGLIFFMFVVGLELDLQELRKRVSSAILVSHVSIALPFILGTCLSLYLYQNYAPSHVPFSSFALFMGIAMSITAFPVLARIIQERNLTHTPLGILAISCAAVDDITAWCLLALVLSIVKTGTLVGFFITFSLSLLYLIFMIKWARPFLAKSLQQNEHPWSLIFTTILLSSLVTELIGIHALFGAFLAGTLMPKNLVFRHQLTEKIEAISTLVFLPLFFTYTGIRTEMGLLKTQEAWGICLLIILVAITGKVFGSAFAARWSGFSWRDSWAIGALMNTRGLMELVVINIGLEIGILSPELFTMMVIMAVTTSVMTGPILVMLRV